MSGARGLPDQDALKAAVEAIEPIMQGHPAFSAHTVAPLAVGAYLAKLQDPSAEGQGDALETEAIERKEIEGEWLTELEAKGYPLTFHNERAPCFSCSLSRVIRGLPPSSGAAQPPAREATLGELERLRAAVRDLQKRYERRETLHTSDFTAAIAGAHRAPTGSREGE